MADKFQFFFLTASHKISRNGPYIPFNFEESFYPMNLFISSCSSFHWCLETDSIVIRIVMLSLNWGHKRRNVVSSQQGAQGACRPPSWPHGCTSWWRPSHPYTSLENQILEIFFQMHLSEMNNFRGRSPIILNKFLSMETTRQTRHILWIKHSDLVFSSWHPFFGRNISLIHRNNESLGLRGLFLHKAEISRISWSRPCNIYIRQILGPNQTLPQNKSWK